MIPHNVAFFRRKDEHEGHDGLTKATKKNFKRAKKGPRGADGKQYAWRRRRILRFWAGLASYRVTLLSNESVKFRARRSNWRLAAACLSQNIEGLLHPDAARGAARIEFLIGLCVLRIELPGRTEHPMPMRGVCHGLPLFRSEVRSVTVEIGIATQLTLAWDETGVDQRVLAYEQGPRHRTLTIYADSLEAAAHLGHPVFSLFGSAEDGSARDRESGTV